MKFSEARAKYKSVEHILTFEQAKHISDRFESLLHDIGKPLRDAPKLPNGLTPDEFKTAEWRKAYHA